MTIAEDLADRAEAALRKRNEEDAIKAAQAKAADLASEAKRDLMLTERAKSSALYIEADAVNASNKGERSLTYGFGVDCADSQEVRRRTTRLLTAQGFKVEDESDRQTDYNPESGNAIGYTDTVGIRVKW